MPVDEDLGRLSRIVAAGAGADHDHAAAFPSSFTDDELAAANGHGALEQILQAA